MKQALLEVVVLKVVEEVAGEECAGVELERALVVSVYVRPVVLRWLIK